MAETTKPYEVAVTGEIYRVVPENNEGVTDEPSIWRMSGKTCASPIWEMHIGAASH